MSLRRTLLALAAALALPATLPAKVVLPPMFTDHMVLQQQTDAPIWGTASPGRTVKVTPSWDGKTYTTQADADGHWRLTLPTPKAGGPYDITLTDGKKLTLTDVMVGEVWICSGQSNMEMPLASWGFIHNYEAEIADANHPDIRLLHVEHVTATQPQTDVAVRADGWQVCAPQSVAGFSATAYFFGREIARTQGVPVGLVHTSWGGTNVESWISGQTLKQVPAFAQRVEQIAGTDLDSLRADYRQRLAQWMERADPGSGRGLSARASVQCDDSAWPTLQFPGKIDTQGLAQWDGVMWLRREVQLPKDWQGKTLELCLGTIDDEDLTCWNGHEVGRTQGYNLERRYTIPARLTRTGRAVVAVRMIDTAREGGMLGTLCLRRTDTGQTLDLSGPWRYDITADIRQVGPMPTDQTADPNVETSLYNAMVHPLVPYAMRGVIWYQGENNASRAWQYRDLFPLLIADWRQLWGRDFPFYYVQLAAYMPRLDAPAESEWAELREAQLQTLHVSGTGMAVTIDCGDAADIHPKDKQSVGHRLALIARARTYGEDIAYSGPIYRSHRIEGKSMVLTFDHADGGLKSADGQALRGFAMAGPDHRFHWATARVVDGEVVVTCPEVTFPMAVRYAWANNPDCNLVNGAGLPASPFRTDDWPGLTNK